MNFRLRLTLGFVTAFLSAAPAFAQLAAQSTPVSTLVDVGDVWRKVRNKPPVPDDSEPPQRMMVLAPVIGAKPDTGFSAGVAGNIARHRGDPSNTHISATVFSFTISQKAQYLSNVRFTAFTSADRWLIVGDNRFQWTSQDTFGLGTSAGEDEATNMKFDFFRVYETAYRQIKPNLYVGGGLLFDTYRNIRLNEDDGSDFSESPNVKYSELHGLPTETATSSGIAIGLRFDNRNSQINPRHGWYADAEYSPLFEGFLGGDSSWQEVDLDLRTYHDLTASGRYRLAGWVFGNFVVDGTAPYYSLPSTGMDTFGRSGRGYPQGRFRGDQLVYGELEYRTTLTANGLVGMVAFVNATTVREPDGGESLFHSVAPAAGGGARLLLNKRSGTNLCFDLGWGRDGSKGVYLSVQEAF